MNDTPATDTTPQAMACVRTAEAPQLCGAKTRNGSPCKRGVVAGRNRCKLHGGATPVGPASASYKHGLYSKVLPPNLKRDYARLLADPNHLDNRAEVGLLQLRLRELAGRLGSSESGEAWKRLQDLFAVFRKANNEADGATMVATLNSMQALINGQVDANQAWAELMTATERVTAIASREWRRLTDNALVATVDQVRLIVTSIADAVMLHVSNPQERQAIADHITRLRIISLHARTPGDPGDGGPGPEPVRGEGEATA